MADRPADRPTVPDVLPAAHAYVTKPGNEVGGSLHIVLEDLNVEDAHVEFCAQWARENDDPDGEALALTLLSMTETQRLRVAHRCWREGGEG